LSAPAGTARSAVARRESAARWVVRTWKPSWCSWGKGRWKTIMRRRAARRWGPAAAAGGGVQNEDGALGEELEWEGGEGWRWDARGM